MTGLVEDLLLLARLDSGRPLSYESTDLSPLVVDAVSDARAAGPGHRWRLELPEEPALVHGDGGRLHQILVNLLANARTHTPEGDDTVTAPGRCAAGGRRWSQPCPAWRWRTTGPGIPGRALLPACLRAASRAGRLPLAGRAGSTGLGLAIVQAVVAAHGGTVTVDSVPGPDGLHGHPAAGRPLRCRPCLLRARSRPPRTTHSQDTGSAHRRDSGVGECRRHDDDTAGPHPTGLPAAARASAPRSDRDRARCRDPRLQRGDATSNPVCGGCTNTSPAPSRTASGSPSPTTRAPTAPRRSPPCSTTRSTRSRPYGWSRRGAAGRCAPCGRTPMRRCSPIWTSICPPTSTPCCRWSRR